MVMAICHFCGGTIFGGKEHKCPPYPFNVIMTDEDKRKELINKLANKACDNNEKALKKMND